MRLILAIIALTALTGMSRPPQDIPAPVDKPVEMCAHDCTISKSGISMIIKHEGFSPVPYLDVAGLPTIGFGHLIKAGEEFTYLDPDQAAELLRSDVDKFDRWLRRDVTVPLFYFQHDALVSLSFNVGRLRNTQTIGVVNSGDHERVPDWIMKWNKARVNGKLQPVRGLTNRRKDEARVYREGH